MTVFPDLHTDDTKVEPSLEVVWGKVRDVKLKDSSLVVKLTQGEKLSFLCPSPEEGRRVEVVVRGYLKAVEARRGED